MMIEGMKIKKSNTYNEELIVSTEYVHFDNENLKDNIEKFQQLKKNGTIINETMFEDDLWRLNSIIDNGNVKNEVKFNFIIQNNIEINNALKCFAIIKIKDESVCVVTVQKFLRHIQQAIDITEFFKVEYFDEFIDKFASSCNRQTLKKALLEFMKFYPINDYSTYVSFLSSKTNQNSRFDIRMLPNYSSILLFDYLLNAFIRSCSRNEKEKYFPIILWWRITKVIPMRPIEFTLLKKECAEFDSDGKYYLNIDRQKRVISRSKVNHIPVLNKIQIDIETYNLIQEYKELISGKEDEIYLLSYYSYFDYIDKRLKIQASKTKKNNGYLSEDQLYNLMDKFYEDIITKKYGYKVLRKEEIKENYFEKTINTNSDEIIMLDLGDTRHLAFCSMMLQGFNPLTIAQIGGHFKLESQMHYQTHLETFVGCSTLILAKQIRKQRLDGNINLYDVYNQRERLISLLKNEERTPEYLQTENGYCWSKNFPFECKNTYCIFCENFELDMQNKDNIKEYLGKLSRLNDNEIKNKIEFLKDIAFDSIQEKVNMLIDSIKQQELETTSKQINNLVSQKALISSYEMECNEIE